MNLQPSADQVAIATAAAKFLSKKVPSSRLFELASDPQGAAIDKETWNQCADLGWLAIGLAEDVGGIGLGLPEEVMLFRELGRHLAPGPFRSSALAARVAARAGAAELARAIASGQRQSGMMIDDLGVDVQEGQLVLRVDEHGAELSEVISVQRVPGVDPGTRFARITAGSVVAHVHGPTVLDRARVLAAAEQLGIIEAVRDMSAAYATTRVQFGTPIGAFQAVKHRCTDMALAAYSTVAQVFHAALIVEAGASDASFHAAAAFVVGTEGAKTSTADNIQNHGAIGFTWEHSAQLFLKRSLLLERMWGGLRAAYTAVLQLPRHEFT